MEPKLRVDYTERILKQEFMLEIATSASKDIILYKLPVNTDSMSIYSAVLLLLLAELVPGGLAQRSAYKAKLQQTGALRTLVWDSDLTVAPLINVGHWTAGIILNLKAPRQK